jgi:hypothetical protein
MLLVVTLHTTGKIDLNSAEVEMTGRALEVLREQLGDVALAIANAPDRRPFRTRTNPNPTEPGKAQRLAAMVEDGFDHGALRAIGFMKIAIVIELEQPEPTAAELLLRNQQD